MRIIFVLLVIIFAGCSCKSPPNPKMFPIKSCYQAAYFAYTDDEGKSPLLVKAVQSECSKDKRLKRRKDILKHCKDPANREKDMKDHQCRSFLIGTTQ